MGNFNWLFRPFYKIHYYGIVVSLFTSLACTAGLFIGWIWFPTWTDTLAVIFLVDFIAFFGMIGLCGMLPRQVVTYDSINDYYQGRSRKTSCQCNDCREHKR